jgi:hypothetical protein
MGLKRTKRTRKERLRKTKHKRMNVQERKNFKGK